MHTKSGRAVTNSSHSAAVLLRPGLTGRLLRIVATAALSLAATATTATAVSAASVPLPARAGDLRCGDVVTHSVRLTHDLTGCPGDGLVVGANGITIDLGGHRISGNGITGVNRIDSGVLADTRHRVTVRNGAVDGFDEGIAVFGGGRNTITRITASGSSDLGILLVDSDRNVVRRNRLIDNTIEGGILMVFGADRNVVAGNVFANDGPIAVGGSFSRADTIVHNTIRDTGSGIILESADGFTIIENDVRNSDHTACDGCGIGIQIYGNRNTVARNTVRDAPRFGIEVDDFQDPGHSPVKNTLISHNRVDRAGVGIAIGIEAGGHVLRTSIEHNLVTRSTADGIQLLGPSTGLETSTLTRNESDRNHGFGINTVPGTHDGGGNRARANGSQPQCVNVACT